MIDKPWKKWVAAATVTVMLTVPTTQAMAVGTTLYTNGVTTVATAKGTITDNVRLRSTAGGGTVLGSIPKGTTVNVLGTSGLWVQVVYNGTTGYVYNEYITVTGSSSNTGSNVTAESFTGTVKVSGGLNVRKGPGTGYAKLGALSNGASVKVTGSTGDWYAIDYNGTTGYVSKSYITKNTTDTDEPDVKDESFTGRVTATGSLNVRKGPGTSYGKLGQLVKGATVKVTGSTGDWYAIDYNGNTGYVSKSYITKDTGIETDSVEKFEAEVNISSGYLRMRKGPDTSYPIVEYFRDGTNVTVTGISGDWYAITYGNKTGYVSKSYIKKVTADDDEPQAGETTKGYITASALNVRRGAGSNYDIIGKLYKGAEVDIYSTSNGWCKIRYNGIGFVSADYVSKEKPGSNESTGGSWLNYGFDMETTLRSGSTGSKVETLQKILKLKGYYSGEIDGVYGSGVVSAVKAFQKAQGLEADGVAGDYTLCSLYSMIYPISKSQLNLKAYDNGSSIPIIKPSWSEANSLLPRRAEFTVVDVRTGYTYKCIRVGGSLHADVEPATATDCNVMYQSFGAEWSWDRRPVWVIYNGVRMAASINCQPHGYETVSGNDMVGQVCIHFVNSRTHGGNAVDAAHQSCINEAYKAGQ